METNTTVIQATVTDELLSPEQAFEWPRQAIKTKNWIEVAQRWAILRKAYPNHPATWFQGTSALIEAGKLKQAEALLNRARIHFPNHPNSLIDFAILAIRRQEWGIAEDFLQQAREKHPGNIQSWIISAECAEGKKDIEQASKFYQKACQINPNHPGSFIQLAELAMRNKQWKQALKHWETLRNSFPNIPAGYIRAAEAARQLNQPKQARKLILTQQYGTEVFENIAHSQNSKKKGAHTNFIRLLELIWTKANFNLRSEVHHNYLSYGWWILEPLLHMLIYYVVFGMLLNRGGENYPVFLLTGLIPWVWFSKAISSSSSSIISGQNLMLQVGLPTVVFPLVPILQTTIKQLPVFLLLIGFVWLQGYPPGIHWWGLIPIVIVQLTFTIAFACTVAAVIPFIRDLSYLVPTGLTFLMFLSGIFYDYRSISVDWQEIFLLNPFAFLLKCYREVLIDGVLPDLDILSMWGLYSTAACLLLMLVYNRLRYVYPRIVMQ